MLSAAVIAVIGIFVVSILYWAVRILREYERGVVFTLGRYTGTKGPGFFLLVPLVQQMVRVDLRVMVDEVPPQDVISHDNVSVKVNAVIYFRVVDAERAIIQVNNYLVATSQLAQTTLRWVLGKHDLDQMLAERTSSMPTFKRCSTSRPRPGASRSLMSRSSKSISTRA